MTEIKLHVESVDDFFARAIGYAREIDRTGIVPDANHLSFTTLDQFLSVLTPKRWALLRKLRGMGPTSIRALAGALARDYKAVHTDVTALLNADLIARDDKGLISVPWTRISAEVELEAA